MSRQEEFDIRRYWTAIVRRKWVVLGSALVFIALAMVLNAVTPPVYRAAARIEISAAPSRSPLTGEVIGSSSPQSENLALFTTAELITNRALLERLVVDLRARGIPMAPEKPAGRTVRMLKPLVDLLRGPDPDAAVALPPDVSMRRDVSWLLRSVSVRPVLDTRLVTIQAEHSDSRAAAEIANRVATLFKDFEASRRSDLGATRLDYLMKQIADVRNVIQTSERSLYGLHQASPMALEARRKQLSEMIAELNTAYVKTRTDRDAAASMVIRVRAFRADSTMDWNNLPVQTPALDDLRRELQKAEAEATRSRQVYREHHPKLVAMEAQCQQLQNDIRVELAKAASDFKGQWEVLSARESDLRGTIAETGAELRSLNNQAYRYSTLESELATNRDLYSLLLKKSQEQGIAQTIEPPLIQIVEPAVVPLGRARPRKLMNLGLGSLVGLIVGVGLALTLEAMRRTIRTPTDIVNQLNLPVLGMLPKRSS